MRQVRDLKDKKSGAKFYPKTHIKAVVDDNDSALDDIMETRVHADATYQPIGEYATETDLMRMQNAVAAAIASFEERLPQADD